MTDITDQILKDLSSYHYAEKFLDENDAEELDQISARFINTEYELLARPHWDADQLDECILEIKQSLMDWVRAGLIAKWVSRYRLWQKKFSSWRDFCLYGLGRESWKIKKLIEHSEIVVYLAKFGFSVLPANQSQVEKLLSCAKKLDCLLDEAWSKVVDALPEQLITANSIAEILGFPSMSVRKKLPKELADRLDHEAAERGLTLEEMLAKDYGVIPDDGELDDNETEEVEPDKIEAWQADLQQLVVEHDREIWLLCTLSKLANKIRSKVSQFSWLRTYRCQT